jgi:hypothetical protein
VERPLIAFGKRAARLRPARIRETPDVALAHL